MPLVDDYDQNEEENGAADAVTAGGASGGGSGGGGAALAAPSKQQESAFVPWSSFVSANEEVSQREAGKIQSQVQGDIDKAEKGRADAQSAFDSEIEKNYLPDPSAPPKVEKPMSGSLDAGAADGAFATQMGGNPWASFLEPETAPAPQQGKYAPDQRSGTQDQSGKYPARAPSAKQQAAAANTADRQAVTNEPHALGMRGALDPNKLKTDVAGGAPLTSGYELAGKDSLETQLGKDAWSTLMGDTRKAESGANALGTEAGVEALIQQSSPAAPNSAFDAALISGAGGKGFRDIAQQYGDGQLSDALTGANAAAQDKWAQLQGDVGASASARDDEIRAATDEMNRLAAQQGKSMLGVDGAGGTSGKGWTPEGYDSLDSFIGGQFGTSVGGGYQDTHTAAAALSPADWLTRGLSEAGVNVPMASEAFGGAVAGGMAPKDAWATADVRTAMQQMQNEYGREALQWLWENMTPEMWDAWKALSNPGSISRAMRQLLEQGGFSKQSTPRNDNEVTAAGATQAEASAGTSAEQETARTNAYRDGWGEEWDRQFREGNQNPQRSS